MTAFNFLLAWDEVNEQLKMIIKNHELFYFIFISLEKKKVHSQRNVIGEKYTLLLSYYATMFSMMFLQYVTF